MTEAPYSTARRDFTRVDINLAFDLEDLRRQLHELKVKSEQKGWDEMKALLLKASSQARAELLFSHRLLASYGSSLPQIRFMLRSNPPELWQEAIATRRQELIDRMAGTMAGKHWIRCMRQPDGWKYVATYLFGEQRLVTTDDVDIFFLMLDETGILNDLMKGRGEDYGIRFMPTSFQDISVMREYISNSVRNPWDLMKKLKDSMEGKEKPKSIMMPIRAAMDAGVLRRPTYEDVVKAFNIGDKVAKSSYNDYTNPVNQPYNEPAFDQLITEFSSFL